MAIHLVHALTQAFDIAAAEDTDETMRRLHKTVRYAVMEATGKPEVEPAIREAIDALQPLVLVHVRARMATNITDTLIETARTR